MLPRSSFANCAATNPKKYIHMTPKDYFTGKEISGEHQCNQRKIAAKNSRPTKKHQHSSQAKRAPAPAPATVLHRINPSIFCRSYSHRTGRISLPSSSSSRMGALRPCPPELLLASHFFVRNTVFSTLFSGMSLLQGRHGTVAGRMEGREANLRMRSWGSSLEALRNSIRRLRTAPS